MGYQYLQIFRLNGRVTDMARANSFLADIPHLAENLNDKFTGAAALFGFLDKPNEALSLRWQMTDPSKREILLETKWPMTPFDFMIAQSFVRMEQTYGKVLSEAFAAQPFVQTGANHTVLFYLVLDQFIPGSYSTP